MFKWLSILATYVPTVIRVVIGIEQALKESKGETKKQIAIALINAGAEAGVSSDSQHVAAISKVIDVTVDALNQSGVFEHKQLGS